MHLFGDIRQIEHRTRRLQVGLERGIRAKLVHIIFNVYIKILGSISNMMKFSNSVKQI